MTYDDLIRYYKTKVPQGAEAEGTSEWNARFNSWTSQLEKELGIPGGDFNDPASGWGGVDSAKLDEFEVTGGGGGTSTVPLEEDLLGRVLDNYVYPGLDRDAANRRTTDGILTDTNRSLDNALQINNANINSGFSAEGYIRNNYPNPADWTKARAGLQQIVDAGLATTLDQAAEYHYNTYGKAEGQKPAFTGTLATERANADDVQAGLTTAARARGTANQGAIDQNNRTLSAAIASSAAARTGAQDAATAQLRAGQTAQEGDTLKAVNDRTTMIDGAITADAATRNAAIARMTAALRDGSTQLDATRRSALAEEIKKLNEGSSTLTTSQLAALADETTSMGQALDVSAQSRDRNLAALEGTRLAAAEGQVAGVNLGLERTRDELTAKQAERGYTGGSSMDDANLARALVGARQDAAGVVGGARVVNATDRRQLGDAIASEKLGLANRDASGRRTIVTDGAGRTFEISNRDATDGRAISEDGAQRWYDITGQDAGMVKDAAFQTAGNRLSNTTAGATDTFAARKTGADNRFAITGTDATNRLGIVDEAAGRTFNLAGQTGERTLSNAFDVNTSVADAANKGTQMKSDYFDNNTTRRLSSALLPATIGSQRIALINSTEQSGNQGLKNALDSLSWFKSNAAPTNAGSFTTTPSQVGNDIAQLGAGIAGSAINVGNANKWWQTPASTAKPAINLTAIKPPANTSNLAGSVPGIG